jgi:enoyl-CoA hydratase/carnithine racemase
MDNKSLRITLDRPPRNTMDLITARVAARGDEDSQVRAILITGSGSAFGTGATLGSAPPPGRTRPRCCSRTWPPTCTPPFRAW